MLILDKNDENILNPLSQSSNIDDLYELLDISCEQKEQY